MLTRPQFARCALSSLSTFFSFPLLTDACMSSPLRRKLGRPREPTSPAPLHSTSAPSSFLQWYFPRVRPVPRETIILKHRRAPGSRSRRSPKVCVIPCRGIHDESSEESFYWSGLSFTFLGSGPRLRCPSFLCPSLKTPRPNWQGKPAWCPTLSFCTVGTSPVPYLGAPGGRAPLCISRR